MDPAVVSETCQEFAGARYYRCGHYFQRDGLRLHRAVWEHHHGPVLDGHHVHHVNDDRADNRLANLAMMPGAEHLSLHWHQRQPDPPGEKALAAAAAWHRSEAGRVLGKENWHTSLRPIIEAPRVTLTCEQCGNTFMAAAHAVGRAKFCHANCRARALRARRRGIG